MAWILHIYISNLLVYLYLAIAMHCKWAQLVVSALADSLWVQFLQEAPQISFSHVLQDNKSLYTQRGRKGEIKYIYLVITFILQSISIELDKELCEQKVKTLVFITHRISQSDYTQQTDDIAVSKLAHNGCLLEQFDAFQL